jgi:hypothetical protein
MRRESMRFHSILNKKSIKRFIFLFLIILISCEYDAPTPPWEEKGADIIPVITNVLPEDAALTREITIVGENFSPVPEENTVYFSNNESSVIAFIKSASATQLVVYRPSITGNSLRIRVTVSGATGVAKYSGYDLMSVINSFGVFLDSDSLTAYTMDIDTLSYIVLSNRDMLRLNPDGTRDESYNAQSSSAGVTDFKMGPADYLYYCRNHANMFRIHRDSVTAEAAVYIRFSTKVDQFDFDQNDNIYVGGVETGLLLLRPDSSIVDLGNYASQTITSIRVYNGYVYVAAFNEASSGIWRHQILSDNGDVSDRELFFDWANAGVYSQSMITDMTFSASGDLYVATNNTYPLFVIHSGVMEPVYYGLIDVPIKKMVWGPGNFLYVLLAKKSSLYDDRQLIQVDIGEAGAIYYGRE